MPELPEVETIRRGLEKYIVGKTIEDIEIRLAKQFHGNPKDVIGATIIGVRRYGKGLLIDLNNAYSLAVHVKMTGQLLYREVSNVSKVSPLRSTSFEGQAKVSEVSKCLDIPNKYTHVIFQLKVQSEKLKVNKAVLYYNDLRQFGWIKVVKTEDAREMQFFKQLGPEPLNNLTIKQFNNIVTSTKMPIKLVLLDQQKIAGIGNIYANDALYRAKIHPKRPASSLTSEEIEELFAAVEGVLQKGIDVGGASEWHYVDVLGQKGQYQNFFLVYRKDGEVCKRCGSIIERIKLGGRGTFYCPECQR